MESVRTTEQKIKVGNLNINYVRSVIEGGSPSKTLLCLPGAMGSAWTDFKNQIEELPKMLPDYQIIAWDPPGQGRSIPPERTYTMNFLEDDADVAYELMKALGIPKYSLLGWSNGGITSLIISGKHPESIDKMVIFGAIAYMTPKEIRVYDFVVDVRNWADHIRKPKEELYGFEYFQKKYREDVEMVKKIYKEKDGNICKEFLKDIQAETLILHGEKDLMVSKEHVPYLLRNIKNSKLILFPNGSHDIHLQFSNEFNKHVEDFLKQ